MKHVLFVCNHNAGRSQMAQALFERHAPDDVRAESAGSMPAKQIWPNVVEAMRGVGLDLAGRRPRKLTVEMQLHADWAVTMGCGDACPYVPTRVDDWDIPDPAHQPLDSVRHIRDQIEERVTVLVRERLDEIRACADAILDEYDEAPVRSFVTAIVTRRTRDCLRTDDCAALAGR
jgi:arsenate reductase (thioredoxin)